MQKRKTPHKQPSFNIQQSTQDRKTLSWPFCPRQPSVVPQTNQKEKQDNGKLQANWYEKIGTKKKNKIMPVRYQTLPWILSCLISMSLNTKKQGKYLRFRCSHLITNPMQNFIVTDFTDCYRFVNKYWHKYTNTPIVRSVECERDSENWSVFVLF